FRLQHMQHFRRRQAGIMRKLHQPCLSVETRSARRRRAIALWRAAQDRTKAATRMHDLERPGLLAGATGELCSPGHTNRDEIEGRDATLKLLLDHLPLNLARRLSKNAPTPSLKSSVAPAIRCDWNSRLSWSSKEFSGLSQ